MEHTEKLKLSEVIRFVLRPQMKLNVSVPRNIFLTRLLPAVSWKRGRPKKARALSASEKYHRAGWKIADLPKDAKAVVCGACQKPGHSRQTCRGLKGFIAGKENQDIFQDI